MAAESRARPPRQHPSFAAKPRKKLKRESYTRVRGANMFSIPPVPDDHPPVACRAAPRPWLDGGMPSYDAFLLLSFGGPEGPDDVLPFLENVTRGRGVPRERLAEVAEHYYACGGVSPINAQCRDMLASIGAALRAGGIGLPLYWGNRNWHPFIDDTVRQMRGDGVKHAIAFVTSAYGSY